jgi:hypothetical protein
MLRFIPISLLLFIEFPEVLNLHFTAISRFNAPFGHYLSWTFESITNHLPSATLAPGGFLAFRTILHNKYSLHGAGTLVDVGGLAATI